MSWSSCYSGSNNIHFNFPTMMSDARNYTNWQPEVVIDKKIQEEKNINSNLEYRKFLQNNGSTIIKHNQVNSCNKCGICPYNPSTYENLSKPYIYSNLLRNDSEVKYNSDLKNEYLSKQILQSRLFTPFTIN